MNAETTLGDLTGTRGNPAIDAMLDRMFGRVPKVLVEVDDGAFQWARPVVITNDEETAPISGMAY